MALDVLLQAQATTLPDLAFRYGCRSRNCGVCTIDVNDKPRIACRARVREGDRLSPCATLPVLSDLVVRRDGIARQMQGRLPTAAAATTSTSKPRGVSRFNRLHRVLCLPRQLSDARAQFRRQAARRRGARRVPDASAGYRWGNPFSLLKLQRIRLDPITSEADKSAALDSAVELGLDACVDCPGCKCGVGIDLKGQVVAQLLGAAKGRLAGK